MKPSAHPELRDSSIFLHNQVPLVPLDPLEPLDVQVTQDQDSQDQLVPQESQDMADLVLEERKESQEALYPIQEHSSLDPLDHPGHLGQKDHPVHQDQEETKEMQASLVYQGAQEDQEEALKEHHHTVEHMGHLGPQGLQGFLDQRDGKANLEFPVLLVFLALQEALWRPAQGSQVLLVHRVLPDTQAFQA